MVNLTAFLNKPLHMLLNAGGFTLLLKTPYFFKVTRNCCGTTQTLLIYNCQEKSVNDYEVFLFSVSHNKSLNIPSFVQVYLSQDSSHTRTNFSPSFSQLCLELKPVSHSKILALYLNLKPIHYPSLPEWASTLNSISTQIPVQSFTFFSTVYYLNNAKLNLLAIALRSADLKLVNAIYFDNTCFIVATEVPSFWSLSPSLENVSISYVVFNPYVIFSEHSDIDFSISAVYCFFNPTPKIISVLPIIKNPDYTTSLLLFPTLPELLSCLQFLSSVSTHCFNGYVFTFYLHNDFIHLSFNLPSNAVETVLIQFFIELNRILSSDNTYEIPLFYHQISMLPFNLKTKTLTVSFYKSPYILYVFLSKFSLLPFFPKAVHLTFLNY